MGLKGGAIPGFQIDPRRVRCLPILTFFDIRYRCNDVKLRIKTSTFKDESRLSKFGNLDFVHDHNFNRVKTARV